MHQYSSHVTQHYQRPDLTAATRRPDATARLHNRRSKRALCTMPGTRRGPDSCQLLKHLLSSIGPEASVRVRKSQSFEPQPGARWHCTSSHHTSAMHFNIILTFTASSLRRSLWNFVYALVSLMRVTCPINLILLQLITLITNHVSP